MKKPLIIGLTTLLAVLPPIFAQEENISELQEFILEETVDDPVGILPERPTDVLFGTGRTIQTLPRSVSIIEGDMLDRYGVQTIADFSSVASGTFTNNFFGIPGGLEIRGTIGDSFFRGFRRVENRGNFPTAITSYSRVEIVRGPPSPYYGGGKVGGFINYIPRTARTETTKFIEKPVGEISLTYGTYDKKVAELEFGIPLSLKNGVKGGFYFYSQFGDSKSYYDFQFQRDRIIQFSVDLDLNEKWSLEFGGTYQNTKTRQNTGWNRLTQDLIDNGTYVTGLAVTDPAIVPLPVFDQDGSGFINESEGRTETGGSILDIFRFGIPQGNPSPNTALNVTGTTKLSTNQVFIDTGNFAIGETGTLYADIVGRLSDSITIKQQFFFDTLEQNKYDSYGFTSDYAPHIIEDKVTLIHDWQPADNVRVKNVFGGSYRISDVDTAEAFSNGLQIIDRRDISVGPTPADRFEGAFTDGRDWEIDYVSELEDIGLFFMSDITIGNNLGLVIGGRWDKYNVNSKNKAGGGTTSDDEGSFTYNASANYIINVNDAFQVVPYITYAESTFLEVDQAGGLSTGVIAGQNWLADSDLWEGGVKMSAFDKKLLLTFDVYQQNRTRFDTQSGNVANTRSTGYELEMRFVPNKHWAFTFAGTWQKTIETTIPGTFGTFTVIPPALLGLTPAEAYGGRYFTGSGFALGSSYEADGQPDKVINIYGSYTGEIGQSTWGATLGTTFVADVFTGRLKFVKLPDYAITNLTIFVSQGKWKLSGAIRNLFDETSFRSQAVFHDVLALPGPGTTADLTLSYSW